VSLVSLAGSVRSWSVNSEVVFEERYAVLQSLEDDPTIAPEEHQQMKHQKRHSCRLAGKSTIVEIISGENVLPHNIISVRPLCGIFTTPTPPSP